MPDNMYTNSRFHFIQYTCFILIFFSFLQCSNPNKATHISINKNDTKIFKRGLKGGEKHSYTIQPKAGYFLHLKAEQHDLDLIAKVSSEDGQFTEQFDSPNGELEAEDIYLLSDADRQYRIEIYPAQKYADPGNYVLRLVRSAAASETDKKWMAALSATQKGDKMRTQTDTRLQSIQQYESAMNDWMMLKDTLQYARAMRSMGFVYIRLRNYNKAIETFAALLPLWKSLRDTRAEGFTYLIIGRVYDLQKEYKKSLEYNLASLPYWIKANDFDQESFVLMNIGNLYSYLGDKQTMNTYFIQALQKNESSKRPSIKAVILRDYGNSLIRISDNDKAVQMYEQSVKQWQATANKPEEARTAILLADYFSKNGSTQKAVHYYRQAIDIWEKLNQPEEVKTTQTALAKLTN
ncbi:MAG: tetratricopeptide repeat protein [Bacteroidota bacterium]|nr:tetratricopeptide repeat protein [Bacteroidota bacterium]